MIDARWPAKEGWVKMAQNFKTAQGKIEVHYVYNKITKAIDDFKINSKNLRSELMMKVKAINFELNQLPENMRDYFNQNYTTPGKIYEVYAIAVSDRISLQFVNDLGEPDWRPCIIFETIDSNIPSDWICNAFPDIPILLCGPEFTAKSIEAYISMVEKDSDPIRKFWERFEKLAIQNEEVERFEFIWKFLNGLLRAEAFGEIFNKKAEQYEKIFGKDLFLEVAFIDFKKFNTSKDVIKLKIRNYMKNNYPTSYESYAKPE